MAAERRAESTAFPPIFPFKLSQCVRLPRALTHLPELYPAGDNAAVASDSRAHEKYERPIAPARNTAVQSTRPSRALTHLPELYPAGDNAAVANCSSTHAKHDRPIAPARNNAAQSTVPARTQTFLLEL